MQIGANETNIKPQIVVSMERPVLLAPRLPSEVSDSYVKTISDGLQFSEDVVKVRYVYTEVIRFVMFFRCFVFISRIFWYQYGE